MLKGNAIIAISKFIKQHIQGEYGMTKNIYVIPRGVNTNIFSPKKVSSARIDKCGKKKLV